VGLPNGSLVGPYEVVSLLGAGGMGEVYRARDITLNRDVALKVLPPTFALDPERLARFKREAQMLASLNHTHIAQIYGFDERGGVSALVMEFVDGLTLADRIAQGRIRLDEALRIAEQIAEALGAAHEKGVVHRDLKPANIKISPDGNAKVLDFGLAKLTGAIGTNTSDELRSQSLTVTAPPMTTAGVILGTASYMSPEQARGNSNLSIQSDQFSFGLVLYELVTGRRAFERSSIAETMTAIIREDAAPLPGEIPVPLRWLIERLLAKDPAERYDSTRDVARDARQIRLHLSETTNALPLALIESMRKPRRRVASIVAVAAASLVAGAAIARFQGTQMQADLSAYRFIPISRDETTERSPSWSPDGKSIAYSASIHGLEQVFTRALGTPDAAQLTRSPKAATNPFWSPNGATIYYRSDGAVWSVSVAGGTPERVLTDAESAVIHPDGKTLAFVRDRKLWLSDDRDRVPHEFGQLPFSFSGREFLAGFSRDGSRLAVLQSGELWILEYPNGAGQKLSVGAVSEASWMPDSRHLVVRSSGSNTLAMVDAQNATSRVILRSRDAILNPAVSPDGKRIAYVAGAIEWNVMEVGLSDGHVRTMLDGGGVSWYPAWAPSGTHYLFATNRSGTWAVEDRSVAEGFTKRVAEPVPDNAPLGELREPSWAPDGVRFAFVQSSPGGGRLLLSNALSGRAAAVDPDASQASGNPVWSPDGEWIAYSRTQRPTRTRQIVRARPGSHDTAEVLWTYEAGEVKQERGPIAWSPAGEWLLTQGRHGAFLLSLHDKTERPLTDREFAVMGFSKNGRQVVGIYRNTTGQGPEWQLYAVDVSSGGERLIAGVDFPVTTDSLQGFSLHPDGTRIATSVAKWPYDIWMMEGF